MDPDRAKRCECGLAWSSCVYVVERRGVHRWIHYRCTRCSREWSLQEADGADPVLPVSADEVIDVHRLLEGEEADAAMAELFRR
jgi:hypothetical protein